MPSNVFATTGTNVSVLFFDNSRRIENPTENDERHKQEKVILIDASKLGEEYKDGNNQRRRLRDYEIDQIVKTFADMEVVEDFSVAVTYEDIISKKYTLAAGQYFDVKIEYSDMTQDEFNERMANLQAELTSLFEDGDKLKKEIIEQLKKVKYE